jgi:hypothetical protein
MSEKAGASTRCLVSWRGNAVPAMGKRTASCSPTGAFRDTDAAARAITRRTGKFDGVARMAVAAGRVTWAVGAGGIVRIVPRFVIT